MRDFYARIIKNAARTSETLKSARACPQVEEAVCFLSESEAAAMFEEAR